MLKFSIDRNIVKMKSKIPTEIENVILQWNKTSAENGDFVSRAFFVQNKEFGHIHDDGTLDIVFGETITYQLLQRNIVQKHLYIHRVAVTYIVSSEDKIPFALSLLRFSYLLKASKNGAIPHSLFETEWAKLPKSLSSITLKQG